MLNALLAGGGLAFASGLNAYLPLLILALADRVSSRIDLEGPFDILSSNLGIVVLLLLLPIELIADKIARVDQLSDRLHAVIRPLAGALAFAAMATQDDALNGWVAAVAGAVIAGLVHAWKARARPAITARTRGIGNPYASVVEDLVAIGVSLVAVSWAWGVLAVVPGGAAWLRRTWSRLAAGTSRVVRRLIPRE